MASRRSDRMNDKNSAVTCTVSCMREGGSKREREKERERSDVKVHLAGEQRLFFSIIKYEKKPAGAQPHGVYDCTQCT